MIEAILFLLEKTNRQTRNTDIAKGLYKYPETWFELKRYLKYKFKNRY